MSDEVNSRRMFARKERVCKILQYTVNYLLMLSVHINIEINISDSASSVSFIQNECG